VHKGLCFYIFRPIWITFGTDVYKNLLSASSLKVGAVNAILCLEAYMNSFSYFTLLPAVFGESQCKRSTMNDVKRL
jgi:hypothetical protein